MRQISLVVAMGILLGLGCGREPAPMNQTTLVNTLVDMHIAEGLTNNHHPIALRDSLHPLYVRQVFETQGISQSQFEEALAYMHRNPEYMNMIYDLVLERIANKSQALDDEEQRKRDMEFDDGVDKEDLIDTKPKG